jgi:hypothetical protein
MSSISINVLKKFPDDLIRFDGSIREILRHSDQLEHLPPLRMRSKNFSRSIMVRILQTQIPFQVHVNAMILKRAERRGVQRHTLRIICNQREFQLPWRPGWRAFYAAA